MDVRFFFSTQPAVRGVCKSRFSESSCSRRAVGADCTRLGLVSLGFLGFFSFVSYSLLQSADTKKKANGCTVATREFKREIENFCLSSNWSFRTAFWKEYWE